MARGKRGDELPEELRYRSDGYGRSEEAKQALEERARQAAQTAQPQRTRRKASSDVRPKPKAQRNFTDPDSRIMKDGASQGVRSRPSTVQVSGSVP